MFKIESIDELDFIRAKVARRDLDYSEIELQCMTQVYKEIGNHYGLKYSLNKSCSSCIKEAMNIVYNYITYHEPKSTKEAKDTKVIMIVTDSSKAYEQMSLPELREAFPHIKKRSKSDFIKAIQIENDDNKEK